MHIKWLGVSLGKTILKLGKWPQALQPKAVSAVSENRVKWGKFGTTEHYGPAMVIWDINNFFSPLSTMGHLRYYIDIIMFFGYTILSPQTTQGLL